LKFTRTLFNPVRPKPAFDDETAKCLGNNKHNMKERFERIPVPNKAEAAVENRLARS
tara:strand:+ start:264 stop:434 length:171 start_codon:yes stop_codon:yes gene_type:complete